MNEADSTSEVTCFNRFNTLTFGFTGQLVAVIRFSVDVCALNISFESCYRTKTNCCEINIVNSAYELYIEETRYALCVFFKCIRLLNVFNCVRDTEVNS